MGIEEACWDFGRGGEKELTEAYIVLSPVVVFRIRPNVGRENFYGHLFMLPLLGVSCRVVSGPVPMGNRGEFLMEQTTGPLVLGSIHH